MKIRTDGPTTQPQAFLRWAGGKIWLTRKISDLFRDLTFERYHEPFLGGGSIFFQLSPKNHSFLSDKNEALIETYATLRDDPHKIIELMQSYRNTEKFYYDLRGKRLKDRIARAAQFIFLNQTSFNGVYRVNLQGKYNVPYGHRTKPFLDEAGLLAASAVLENTTIRAASFVDTLPDIQEGDLVFLDPPYTVSHNKNGFIKYNKSLFCLDDQLRLAHYIAKIEKLGAKYIMTNAAHERVREIFKNGDNVIELKRASLIGGKNAKRGPISELLFTNLEVHNEAT